MTSIEEQWVRINFFIINYYYYYHFNNAIGIFIILVKYVGGQKKCQNKGRDIDMADRSKKI